MIAHAAALDFTSQRVCVLQPIEYLNKLPKTLDKEDRVLVSDPMVATGGSMLKVLEDLVARGADPALIRVISITVAPPALKLLSEKFPGKWQPELGASYRLVMTPSAHW